MVSAGICTQMIRRSQYVKATESDASTYRYALIKKRSQMESQQRYTAPCHTVGQGKKRLEKSSSITLLVKFYKSIEAYCIKKKSARKSC